MKEELERKRDGYINEHFNSFISMADDNVKKMNELTGDKGRRADKIISLCKACQKIQMRELNKALELAAENLNHFSPQFALQKNELTTVITKATVENDHENTPGASSDPEVQNKDFR